MADFLLLIFSFLLGLFTASYVFYKQRHIMLSIMAGIENRLDKVDKPKDKKKEEPKLPGEPA